MLEFLEKMSDVLLGAKLLIKNNIKSQNKKMS